eukprot:NODE_502_length_6703_cov_1.353574.p1 type:complete len:444 gc:universal NODE_502_length_6703_cov_1.353574:4859-3528(-)
MLDYIEKHDLRPFLTEFLTNVIENDDKNPLETLKVLIEKEKLGSSPLKSKKSMLGRATLPDTADSELWKSHPAIKNIVFVLGSNHLLCSEQCTLLANDFKFEIIDTKLVIQKFISTHSSDSLASAMQSIAKNGSTLPPEIMLYLVKAELVKALENNPKGFFIQGYPLDLVDAVEFEKQVQKCCFAINFSLEFSSVQSTLEYPDISQADSIKSEIFKFQTRIEPVLSYFKKFDKFAQINSEGNAESIFQLTRQVLVEKLNFLGNTIILSGGPASGKGTMSDLIMKNHVCCHISTGDLLREEIKKESFIGLLLKESIARGDLVPDDLIMNLLLGKVNQCKRFPLIILDGFPRTVEQAKLLSGYLDISKVLYFKCAKETLVKRILNRGLTSGRADDNENTANHRIETFLKETMPVLDYYSEKNLVFQIDAEAGVEEVWERVCAVLK